jgi:phosphoserine phosphatase
MDGVIFNATNFWLELHKKLGTYEKGLDLTKKYVHTDYARLVEEVVSKLWKNKSAIEYFELVKKAEYITGVQETFTELKKRNIQTALITSGASHLALRAQSDLGIDFVYANELVIKNNIITGEFKWPVGFGLKEKPVIVTNLVKKLGYLLKDTVYIGDNDNDIEVCKIVGLSIAFNSMHAHLKEVCNISIEKKDLRQILRYLY